MKKKTVKRPKPTTIYLSVDLMKEIVVFAEQYEGNLQMAIRQLIRSGLSNSKKEKIE